jgi:hypothetical protein
VHPAGIKYFPEKKARNQIKLIFATRSNFWVYQFEHLFAQLFQIQERWDTTATFL